ncbi:hypothetical protein HPB51_011005 [Rhipicephalus microplus]|uniref:Uncharacterized protein n=1 Tax=Rhipicephalus microplus TaxID=6941 RepID=A0A9J6EN05_RHIMP|nr:hypothetical protein HPB51_011005 [Rhipicephalus microplus]
MPCQVNLLRPAHFTPNLKTPTMKTTTACTSVPVNSSDFPMLSHENETMDATQSTLSSESSTGPRVHDTLRACLYQRCTPLMLAVLVRFQRLQESPRSGLSYPVKIKKTARSWSQQVARLIRKRNPALTVREKPRFTTRDGVRLKPALLIESDDQVIMIDLAIVWDANEGVLKHKAGEKGAKYRVLKDLSDRQKAFSLCGMVFGARSMVCRETVELGLALRFS